MAPDLAIVGLPLKEDRSAGLPTHRSWGPALHRPATKGREHRRRPFNGM